MGTAVGTVYSPEGLGKTLVRSLIGSGTALVGLGSAPVGFIQGWKHSPPGRGVAHPRGECRR
eukprot:3543683-Pyramimonas_sp.AAC.1